ncbi:dynein axonemal heavy chain 7 isoform X2 [Diorhabda carinulata]|uniref:dynein axonemal heavy chain 7 isoform X2 n=1 Tax=Diorhabda carinulata TaxID=1163345 RepID=UPI0025A1C7FD|nr:dynein axonemal heavy chain 7 isoform X2 [Diorhabda carinulata]
MNKFKINKKKREKLLQFQAEFVKEEKIKEFKHRLTPLYPQVPRMDDSHKKIRAKAELCPSTPMSIFQGRCITNKVAARGLEKKFPWVIPNIMEEAKEDFIRITHLAGVNLKSKPIDPDIKRFALEPYKYFGKTPNYSIFLWTRKQFRTKYLLQHPLVKKIFIVCSNLPEILFNLGNFRVKPHTLEELDDIFNHLVGDSENLLLKFYDKVCQIVESDNSKLDQDNYKHLLKVCTGLVSVYMSLLIQNTIKHIIEVTKDENLIPYLQLSLKYSKNLYMHPNQQDIILLYSLFISKLVDLGTNFPVLEVLKIKNYPDKLTHLNITDEFYEESLNQLGDNIIAMFIPIDEYLRNIVEDFKEMFLDFNMEEENEKVFETGCLQIRHFRNYISKASSMLGSEYFGIGQLVLSEYVASMKESLSIIIEDIFNKICEIHINENENICLAFENIRQDALRKLHNSEELIAQGQYMVWVKTELLLELRERIQKMLYDLTQLMEFGTINKDHMDLNTTTVLWLKNIETILEQYSFMYEQLKFEAEERLQKTIAYVNAETIILLPLLKILDDMDDYNRCRDYVFKIKCHLVKIKELRSKIIWINKEQRVLGFNVAPFKQIEDVEKFVYPFFHLIKMCMDIQRHIDVCLYGPFEFLDFSVTENVIEDYMKELLKIQKAYRLKCRISSNDDELRFFGSVDDPDTNAWPSPLRLTAQAIQAIKDFRPAMTMMRIMCNDALMKRHWKEMSALAGFDLTPNAGTTLFKLTQMEELKEQLQDIVNLIRDPSLTNLSRITIKALIVIDVHAKDVVDSLFKERVTNDREFKWLSQMRYYLEDDEALVRLINATVKYAYEYLGNSDRLVITPLTDRCYRTLIGAYHLHLNGAPEGPAGTGKTETTKDLAKALAVQCVVFNCSDGLDYKAMGKFFKGLASCGAWVCFDEFNRIDIEVLSVVAQQILLIITAVRAHAAKFNFEGTEIKLNPTCYVCITMNPGYAGRTELPDNLKVLFRTVAMMVPDYAMIGEISLYSYGFVDARNLSVKIVTVYRLCSEQLSSQNHYDYGMRAVKSVLSAAGNNKRKFPDLEEDILLLRAILDVNLPKFLNQDLPLFDGIISDLFPGVVLPEADYTKLVECMKICCEKRKLIPKDCVITKVIQTYEMMIVRWGFMIVGYPLAGKTSTLRVLADTLTLMNKQGLPEEKVEMLTMNPKAITMGQLYGQFDPISYEWFDGVIATGFRNFCTNPSPHRKWMIFDGPVDAVWIENMNSVLDDNRKLCLMSGEVMSMTSSMSLIFEVMDLEQASPATVSRCGMIYMEPVTLGWEPFVESWLPTCNPIWCGPEKKDFIHDMLYWIIPPSLMFIRKNCIQFCNPGEISLVLNMINIFQMHMDDAVTENPKREDQVKYLDIWTQVALIQSGVWGIASILDQDSRDKFDEFYRELWRGENEKWPYPACLEKLEVSIPAEGIIFDYSYSYKMKGNWKFWPAVVKTERVDECKNIMQALIPTVDTARYMLLVDMHIRYGKPCLLIGPTGTGKSFYITDVLLNRLNKEKYEPAFITFTVQITCNQTQELVISKLNKRKRGHYGPPKGKTTILFIDDVNMPAKEGYGAQPPLELLRQYFDHKNWYDLKTTEPLYLHDLMFLGAMGLVGGSRQDIYPRFLRHFSIFSINEFSRESMAKIYSNVLLLGWKNNGFPSEIINVVNQVVNASLDMFTAAQENLRPTPSKSHYIFNLRDFSRLIQGCAMLKKESADDKKIFAKIWVHEILRIFYDRLIEDKDRIWVYEKVRQSAKDSFREHFDMLFENLKNEEGVVTRDGLKKLIFGTFFDQDSDEDKRYEEILNIEALRELSANALYEFNATHKTKMDIVLFDYALEHLSKIGRVLSMRCGSALLVGISGSGRQSLTRLAGELYGYGVHQAEITNNYSISDWRDDIKKVLKESGGKGKDFIFLIGEGQIKEEFFLQDVDCLLNSGEVPNMYQIDEKQEILDMVRLAAQGGNRNLEVSPLEVFFFFTKRCKEKLHIILCFSPVGSAFRNRLRLFPALINCCTIDWFEDWPEQALEEVAHTWMEDINLSDEIKGTSVIACKYFHVEARKASMEFYEAVSRRTYITSASYLELIKSFTDLTNRKQDEIMKAKKRYLGGLEKLYHASVSIGEMQKSLAALQPQLEIMSKQAADMLQKIEQESITVEQASAVVKQDEKVANKQAAQAQALKLECEADLAEAMPVLEEAIAALDTLKPSDIVLVKSMKNPPEVIKLVMAAVCIIKGIKPDRVPEPGTGRMVLDFWGPSKRLLGDMNFLQSLKDFDKDNIKPDAMAKIRKEFIPHKDFKPNIVAKASSAAEGLCKWIIAMDMYDKVYKVVAPKKAKLKAAEEEFSMMMTMLIEKRAQVEKLEEQLAVLREKLEVAQKKQQELQDEVDLCNNKLIRAKKLIGGLGGEKTRWTAAAEALQLQFDGLAGDILMSCGIISYLSPFNNAFRVRLVQDWHRQIKNLNIPTMQIFEMTSVLGSDVTIQHWNINGLPRDTFSTENGIIMDNSRRWSLFIDPQVQAANWIKKMEKRNNLLVVKFSFPDYMKRVETCIQNGYPVLIENVEETLEAPLDPVLYKQTFKQAGMLVIALGENVVEYNTNFKLYLTSKLRNPHYLPEVFNKVTIINFALTLEGLQDQLLGIVVAVEKPDLQQLKEELTVQKADNKRALKETEDNILKTLSETKGDILEDEKAIQILDESKILSTEIMEKQERSIIIEKSIEEFRDKYKIVSEHSAVLYYCISDLANVDPMYQYSLDWFINLYIGSIQRAEKFKIIEKRCQCLINAFTFDLYSNITRSLFEKDKLLFSFLLCSKIMIAQGRLDEKEFLFVLTGGVGGESDKKNPCSSWLPDKSWKEICKVENIPSFKGFSKSIVDFQSIWKEIYDNFTDNFNVPHDWEERLTSFRRLIVIRILRADRLINSITNFVKNEMDDRFIKPPPFNISVSYGDSYNLCPLIFILSPGVDPMSALVKFAGDKKMADKFKSISLGQGQGPVAQAMIQEGVEIGTWVCLQNCHLATSWMPTLEKIFDDLDFDTHPEFRLWLTSYPSNKFPVTLLQKGVKMTNEPPTGLQNNLLKSYISDPVKNPEFFKGCVDHDEMFIRLLYGLAFFHACIQERRTFGPLGWNIAYGFNDSDFDISVQQLQMFINESDDPYEALSYLIGECNYGGRVTDDWDRRLIVTILRDYLNPKVVSEKNYSFSDAGSCYGLPEKNDYQAYIHHINSLPVMHPPEVFGLHTNAGITRDLQNSNLLLNSVLKAYGDVSAGGAGETDKHIMSLCSDILGKLPKLFDIELANVKYPVDYSESMNTVLVQEMERFNKLLKVIVATLITMQKAIQGLVAMSPETEAFASSLLLARIPGKWAGVSYPSLKNLPNYVADFIARIDFLQQWFISGKPPCYWVSGFFFTQAFLTGVKQNYARKYTIAIDKLTFDFNILKIDSSKIPPNDGAYIYGLFTDGARWDKQNGKLAELYPKVLFDIMPIIWIIPILTESYSPGIRYVSPVYKTSERKGTLSTTGHSTNYVLPVLLDTDLPATHWIKRSVALLCQLN